MKRVYSLVLLCIGLLIGFLCGALITTAYSDQTKIDYEQPIARIGDTVVTRGQLAEYVLMNAGDRLKELSQGLYDQALVAEAARHAGVTVTADEVNGEVEQMAKYARGSMAPMKYRNIPRPILVDQARTMLLAEKMIGLTVSEGDAHSYYSSHPNLFVTPAMAKVVCIAPDSMARANAVLKRLQAGEDPNALAALYCADPGLKTNKGELGWITRKRFNQQADQQIFDAHDGAGLKPGEWTGVIKYDYVDPQTRNPITSYLIFYIKDIAGAKTPKFEEVRDAAYYGARMTKYAEKAPIWFAKMAREIGKDFQQSPNLLDPLTPLKASPMDPEWYYKPKPID